MKSCGDEGVKEGVKRRKENYQRERIKLCQKLLPDSLEIIMDSKWTFPPSLLSHFIPIQLKPSSSLQLLLPFIPPFIHHPNFFLFLLLLLSTLPLSLYTVSFSLSLSFYTPHLLSTVFSINQFFFSVSIATSTNHTPDPISILILQAFPAPLLFCHLLKAEWSNTHIHTGQIFCLRVNLLFFLLLLLFISSLSPTPPTRPLHLLVFFQIKPHTHTHSFASLSFPHLDSLFIPMVFSIILSICLYKHTRPPTHYYTDTFFPEHTLSLLPVELHSCSNGTTTEQTQSGLDPNHHHHE